MSLESFWVGVWETVPGWLDGRVGLGNVACLWLCFFGFGKTLLDKGHMPIYSLVTLGACGLSWFVLAFSAGE